MTEIFHPRGAGVRIEASPLEIAEGGVVVLRATVESATPGDFTFAWTFDNDDLDSRLESKTTAETRWDTTGLRESSYRVVLRATPTNAAAFGDLEDTENVTVRARQVNQGDTVPVTLRRTGQERSADQLLWMLIRNRTQALGFDRYDDFITPIMCGERLAQDRVTPIKTPFTDVQAYNLLKVATEIFVMGEVGVIPPATQIANAGSGRLDVGRALDDLADIETDRGSLQDEDRRVGYHVTAEDLRRQRDSYFDKLENETAGKVLPYLSLIRERLEDVPLKAPEAVPANCYGVLTSQLTGPLALELIWSYWHEEGMLVQTLNAVSSRFQNRRAPGRDPMARLNLDPLRPLANLIWGYVQDEQHRLTLTRRSYEYDHLYGLRLIGRSAPRLRPADSRSKFLEAFHALLHRCILFFHDDDDTTVIADGFGLLNSLREVHLLLAEGAHNQFGDLPSTARVEMLMQQWLLARNEMREFLGGRIMVPYAERWMDRVDTMKSMQRWTDVTVTHFRDLGVHGEQILLTIRYGDWNRVNDPSQAINWARYWRPEIQRYIHAYRAATGVDLGEKVDVTLPGLHLQRRLAQQRAAG